MNSEAGADFSRIAGPPFDGPLTEDQVITLAVVPGGIDYILARGTRTAPTADQIADALRAKYPQRYEAAVRERPE